MVSHRLVCPAPLINCSTQAASDRETLVRWFRVIDCLVNRADGAISAAKGLGLTGRLVVRT